MKKCGLSSKSFIRFHGGVIAISLVFSVGVIFHSLAALPNTIDQLNVLHPTLKKNEPSDTVLQQTAKQWHLTVEDYRHYQWLMQHTPSRQWYAQLDPPEVLALNTDDEKKLRHYTEAFVKITHQRVTRELAFNRLYGEVFHALYPNEKAVVIDAAISAWNTWQPKDRLWLFVRNAINSDKENPQSNLQTLLNRIALFLETKKEVTLDIFLVGNNKTQQNLLAWAKQYPLPSALQHRVSLNNGNDRYRELSRQAHQSLQLPLAVRYRNGQVQPLKLDAWIQTNKKGNNPS